MRLRFIFYIALFFLIYSCRQGVQNKETPLFSLLPSLETGIDFINQVPYNVMNDNNVLSYQYYYNGGGVCLGDINNDELLNLLDIITIINLIINEQPFNQVADSNNDYIIDIIDLIKDP